MAIAATPQQTVSVQLTGAATSAGVTITSAPIGSVLLFHWGCIGTSQTATPSSPNTTWTKISGASTVATNTEELWMGVVAGGASGTTVTITSAQAQNVVQIRGQIAEWRGLYATPFLASATSGTASSPTTASVTPVAGKNTLVIATERCHASVSLSSGPTNSFTDPNISGSALSRMAYLVVGSASGSYSTSWTMSGSVAYFTGIVVFYDTAPPGNTNPTAAISTPANNSTSVPTGTSVSFAGTGSDAEDGSLTGASLVWTSSINGQIGTGTSFSTTGLSVGVHTITLKATDSQGAFGTATRTVTITSPSGTIYDRTVNYTTTLGVAVTASPFKVFIPANFDNSIKHPTILVLGGAGQRDNNQMSDGLATRVQANLSTWPTITIFPQWPGTGVGANGGREWAYPMIAAVQAAVEAEWNIDTSRRYVTGFSLGALVGFEYLWQQPTFFAAGLFGEGYVNANSLALTTTVNPLTNRHAADMVAGQCTPMPIRHYLSDGDTTTGMQSGSLDTKAAFEGVDPNYVFVPLSGLSHTAAYMAMYNDNAAFTWLYAQGSRVDPPLEFDTTRKDSDFAGMAWSVSNAAQFAAALAGCADGDRIEIAQGATVSGQFTLRNRGTSGWVEIRTAVSTSALDSVCPQNTRMDPTKAGTLNLATIENGASNGGILTAKGARGYRFTAVKFTTNQTVAGIVRLGEGLATSADIPSYIWFDRVYSPGSTNAAIQPRRLVNGVASYGCVKDSYIAKMVDSGSDSQAIAIYGCKGPWLVQNNYGEGWGELLIVGGANALPGSNPDSTPSDVVIRGNYFKKDLSLKNVAPFTYAKNGLELKSVNRCLVENNIIENTFRALQAGYGILVKSDNSQDNSYGFAGSRNVEIRNNWVRNVACGFQFAANPDGMANIVHVNRVWVHDNLFENINKSPDNLGDGLSIAFDGDLKDIWFEHNTFVKGNNGGNIGVRLGAPGTVAGGTMMIRSNIFWDNQYGVKQDSGPRGGAAVTAYLSNTTQSAFLNNVLVGSNAVDDTGLPSPNYRETGGDGSVGYTDLANGVYALAGGSPYKGVGHDGLDPGISNWSVFAANLANVQSGTFSAPVAPVATSIVWATQPGSGVNDTPLGTPGQLQVLDQFGVLKSDFNGTLTLTGIGATVTTGGTVTVTNGVGTPVGLTLTATVTTAFQIIAAGGGLASDTSAPQTLTVVTSVPTNTIPKSLPSKFSAKAGKTLILLWFLP